MTTLVHPVRSTTSQSTAEFSTFFANAVYYGNGMMVYGVGLPAGVTRGGRSWNYASAPSTSWRTRSPTA